MAARKPVTDAYLAMLRARTWPNGDPLSIGDATAPEPPSGQAVPTTPYASISGIPGGTDSGPMGDPHADASHNYQALSVGDNRGSAEAMAAQVREATLGMANGSYAHPIEGGGRIVVYRGLLAEGGATREGDRWNVVDQFELRSTPEP